PAGSEQSPVETGAVRSLEPERGSAHGSSAPSRERRRRGGRGNRSGEEGEQSHRCCGDRTEHPGHRTQPCAAVGSPAAASTIPHVAVDQQSLNQLRAGTLTDVDPAVAELLGRELDRQRGQIELIASENFTWPSILEA